MKTFNYLLAAIILALVPYQVLAQSTAAQVTPGYLTTTGCTPATATPCFRQYGQAPPVGTTASVGGTQTSVSVASATGLTIPTGATGVLVDVQGTNNTSGVCLYWRDDGTNPTASTGHALPTGAYLVPPSPTTIKFITATSATCSITVSYYTP